MTDESSRRAPRVVFLDHCAAWSGGEIALKRLLDSIPDWHAIVVLGEDGPLVGELQSAGIDVRVLPLDPRTNRLSRSQASPHRLPVRSVRDVTGYVKQLTELLRQEKPDLVYANSLKSGLYGCLAARRAGVPVVWHVRDRIASDYLPPSVVRLVRSMLLVLPDGILVNSAATRETLGWAVQRTVPHQVLFDPYRPSSRVPPRTGPRHHTAPVVALVGRLAPWKGQHLFLDALERLHEQGVPMRGRLLGSALFGEEEYAQELKERISRPPLCDLVTMGSFTGDVGEALSDVDIVVSTSTIPEPFGQVIVEAISNGVPVVVPDQGGPAEIVKDGASGLTYKAGDAGDLAGMLDILAATQPLYRRLSAEGLSRARDFDPDVVGTEFQRFASSVGRIPLQRRIRRLSGLGDRDHPGDHEQTPGARSRPLVGSPRRRGA